jgi:hypothetical protein
VLLRQLDVQWEYSIDHGREGGIRDSFGWLEADLNNNESTQLQPHVSPTRFSSFKHLLHESL